MKYSKNHTVYYNDNGNEVPSATTILKILNKPALVKWANYLGFRSLDVDAVLNESAELGTLIHDLIHSILCKHLIVFIPSEKHPNWLIYSYIKKFKTWLNTNTVEPIILEKSFSTDNFGGTVDFYGKINGKYTILDFKTSKKIHITMFIQLALYCILLEKHGYTVEQVGILLVNNKNDGEKFISREELEPYVEFAKGLVGVFHSYYNLNDKYKWNEFIL